jgi:hypothetical protein
MLKTFIKSPAFPLTHENWRHSCYFVVTPKENGELYPIEFIAEPALYKTIRFRFQNVCDVTVQPPTFVTTFNNYGKMSEKKIADLVVKGKCPLSVKIKAEVTVVRRVEEVL